MFGVHGAESFQSEYQKLVEIWLRRFTEIERANQSQKEVEKKAEPEVPVKSEIIENQDSQSQGKDIKVFDREGNLLYGETESGKVCQITPEQIQKLEAASESHTGNVVKGLSSLQIQVDGETFFQSENEEVLLNRKVDLTESITDNLGGIRSEESSRTLVEEVRIYHAQEGDSELVYGKAGQNFVNQLSPEQIHQLESAVMLSPGANFSGLSGLKVKVDESVIFQVDELGNVLVNQPERLQQAMGQVQQQSGQFVARPISQITDYSDDYYSNFEYYNNEDSYISKTELSAPKVESKWDDVTTEILVEMMAPIIEQMPDIERLSSQDVVEEDLFFKQPEERSNFRQNETVLTAYPQFDVEAKNESVGLSALPEKSGLDAVQEALEEMRDGPLKSVIQGMAVDMQTTVTQQQSNPTLDKLMEERSRQSQNPHWWQQLSTKVEMVITSVRDNFTQHRAASTLKEFANQMGLQSGGTYEGAEYNLSRQGKDLTLSDKQGNELLKFQSTVLGVKVEPSLPPLDDGHFQKIEELRQEQKEGKQPEGAFISSGAAEAKNLQRINRITEAMSQYAASCGGMAKVEGKFSYDWQSNGAGSAMIQDKQGNVLLAVGQGHVRSRMGEKDLQHFEQMLPALQVSLGQQSHRSLQDISKGKQIEM
jgi:hypothetical protein